MRIEYLHEFVTLADLLSFTEASKRLYITQPALSKHIASIEKELGAKLVERTPSGIRLTDAGRVFLDDARVIVGASELAAERVRACVERGAELIRIGYLRDAALRLLIPLQRWFASNHPEVELRFVSADYLHLPQLLDMRKVDAILTMDDDPALHGRCGSFPVYDDTFIAAIPKDDPLVSRETIGLADLAGRRLLLPSMDVWPNIRSFYEAHLPDEAKRDSLPMEDVDTLFFMIESGQGVGVVASHNKMSYESKVAFVPLRDEGLPVFPVGALWPSDACDYPVAARRIELLCHALAAIRDDFDGSALVDRDG